MSALKSMTKAQLLAHIDGQDAKLVEQGRQLEALRLQLSVAKAHTPTAKIDPHQPLRTYTRADGALVGVFQVDWKTRAHRVMEAV